MNCASLCLAALLGFSLLTMPTAMAGPACFEYTPGSLSNVCVNAGVHPGSTPVTVPSVCIVGPVCTPSETVSIPTGNPYYAVEYLEVLGLMLYPDTQIPNPEVGDGTIGKTVDIVQEEIQDTMEDLPLPGDNPAEWCYALKEQSPGAVRLVFTPVCLQLD